MVMRGRSQQWHVDYVQQLRTQIVFELVFRKRNFSRRPGTNRSNPPAVFTGSENLPPSYASTTYFEGIGQTDDSLYVSHRASHPLCFLLPWLRRRNERTHPRRKLKSSSLAATSEALKQSRRQPNCQSQRWPSPNRDRSWSTSFDCRYLQTP